MFTILTAFSSLSDKKNSHRKDIFIGGLLPPFIVLDHFSTKMTRKKEKAREKRLHLSAIKAVQ